MAKFAAGYQSDEEGEIKYSNIKYSNTGTVTENVLGNLTTGASVSFPVFKPLKTAYDKICIGDVFKTCRNVAESSEFYGLNSSNCDSHLTKNSEWGAVWFLANSIYGGKNNDMRKMHKSNITGLYGAYSNRNAASVPYGNNSQYGTQTAQYSWYETNGISGSTTNNTTGVYDLNPTYGEFVSGLLSCGSENISNYGANCFVTENKIQGYKTLSTKYITYYPYSSSDDTISGGITNLTDQYNLWKESPNSYGYGDAICELMSSLTIRRHTGNTNAVVGLSIYKQETSFATYSRPFVLRGGPMFSEYDSRNKAYYQGFGELRAGGSDGGLASWGFRCVLVGK